ncbi:hypothetical protein BDV95DRAFT_131975 [Massariosphaeria phaeospora]|uniref:Uncharacterized protein n=1 Tax=Massariosphaeria phaeospora TaxID=100035 RepID=A0A7C8IG74_9PLEO|nr:hypothetical protein BDV95DRAFT_131975 [Massariosphaeria phaeospora]
MPPQLSRRHPFDLSCPYGGEWYACDYDSYFVGCCTSSPCSTGCAQEDTRPATFNRQDHELFPDASCQEGRFYTCAVARGTFWGCCESDPCEELPMCPNDDLFPAFMNSPGQIKAYVTEISSLPASTTTTTNSASATSCTIAIIGSSGIAITEPSWISITESSGIAITGSSKIATITSSIPAIATETIAPRPEKKPTAAIAGGVAGGVVLALVGFAAVYYLLHVRKSCKLRRKSMEHGGPRPHHAIEEEPQNGTVPPGDEGRPACASPNPNIYPNDPADDPKRTYHQYSQEPQELPAEPVPRTSVAREPVVLNRERAW